MRFRFTQTAVGRPQVGRMGCGFGFMCVMSEILAGRGLRRTWRDEVCACWVKETAALRVAWYVLFA